MPIPTDPPSPAMPQSIFDDLQTLMTYDSTTGGYYDGNNVLQYLFVDSDTNGNARWTYTAKLAPGVYHYAFVAADGTWFVPRSVRGRQNDGMGGEVAVLVVP